MRTLFIDYETYYDEEYSLSKMIRTHYLNDMRFQAHGAAVAIDDSPFTWVPGDQLQEFFNTVGPHIDAMCCHNGLFDHGITSLYYWPKRVFLMDTMSMAQCALARRFPGLRMSAAAMAKHYWPNDESKWKYTDVLSKVRGLRTEQIPGWLMQQLIGYALQDGEILRGIFLKLLAEDVPWHTVMEDISITLAMGVYPQLEMDIELAALLHKQETAAKEKAAIELNIDRADLRSANKLADLYRSLGVEPPTKKNAKGETTYAFASKDEGFLALLDHEDPRVAALTELRIGEKSAQTMTRSGLFSTLPRSLPVPLRLNAAHTGRHGGMEYNMQNPNKKSRLRECIRAPLGYKLVVVDAAQIELRINAWFCGEETLLSAFREGRVIYAELATAIFGRTITKGVDDFEYFVGKQGELACQYQAGVNRVTAALKAAGVEGADEAMAKRVVNGYRSTRTKIKAMWDYLLYNAIPALAGLIPSIDHRGLIFEHGRVRLPSGRYIWYPELHVDDDGEWKYKYVSPKGVAYWKKLYGGSLLENLVQAMAYDVFMFHARTANRMLPMAMPVHDEGVYVVPDQQVDAVADHLVQVTSTPPDWLQGVILKGEVGVGQTYAEAK